MTLFSGLRKEELHGNEKQRISVNFCFRLGKKSFIETFLMFQKVYKEDCLSRVVWHER